MTRRKLEFTLYLVTDRRPLDGRCLEECVGEAILGGVTIVQLREKDISSGEYLDLAVKVKSVTDRYGIPLIINDRVDIALAVDADGVHVGPEDLPVPVARRLLGPRKIIGASACSIEEALSLQARGADYLGVGAVYPSATKPGTEKVSLEDLRRIKSAVTIPVVAIGGIDPEKAPGVIRTGVDGVAVVSAIMGSPDIREAARQLLTRLKEAIS